MYIPWKLRALTYKIYQYSKSIISRSKKSTYSPTSISFCCAYHQVTGSSIAIASIANNLADRYSVDAYLTPRSGYTRLLDTGLKHRFSKTLLKGKIIFFDIEQDPTLVKEWRNAGKITITTCHAFPTTLHSVDQDNLEKLLEYCNKIHFVSEHQRNEFINYYHNIKIREKSFVVSNYIRRSKKTEFTYSIGIVGHLNRSLKNAKESIELAAETKAKYIECWGSSQIAEMESNDHPPNLKINGWHDNMEKIHDSFDVLISLSHYETFGLVVAEALSAGIPCFLSDIPVYKELYSDFPGVVFQSGNNARDTDSINRLLALAPSLKSDIISFWEEKFSEESIQQDWYQKIDSIIL